MTDINLRMSPKQFEFLSDETFLSLFVGGVGSGKTWIGARKAFYRAMRYPRAVGLIAANTHAQLHQSTLPQLWDAIREHGLADQKDFVYNRHPPDFWKTHSKFKEHNGVISFRNGAQIVLKTLIVWQSVLGLTLGWAWLDESRGGSRINGEKVRRGWAYLGGNRPFSLSQVV